MLGHSECRSATIDRTRCNDDLEVCSITSQKIIRNHIVSIVMLLAMDSTGFRPWEELQEYIDLAR